MKANNPLTVQRLEILSSVTSTDINSSTMEVRKMCGSKSEVEVEEERKVLQQKHKEEAKKASAKSSDDCCEPLCSPITCGP